MTRRARGLHPPFVSDKSLFSDRHFGPWQRAENTLYGDITL